MAIYPGAVQKLVPRTFAHAPERNRINLHTAVTNASSLYGVFSKGGACSHFYVAQDGTVEQYIDTDRYSAADLDGNDATVSIETWDGYPSGAPGYWANGSDVPPWTAAQLVALVALCAWIMRTHEIPARLATDAKVGASSHGLAWHRLGVDGTFPSLPDARAGRLQRGGGMHWSTARGKACPGDRRIGQVPEILEGVLRVLDPTSTEHSVPDVQEDDMTIIRRASDGAAFVVLGGRGSRLVSATDMGAYQRAGAPVVQLSDEGYAVAETRYLKAA